MKLNLCEQEIRKEEISEILASLTSGFVTMGDKVRMFEDQFAEYIGVKNAVMVNSGSSANLLMVKAAATSGWGRKHLRRGDHVFVPALSWSTTYFPVVQSGLTPVLVDCDPHTLNIGPLQIEEAFETAPRTKALLIAHIMGNPAQMDVMTNISNQHGWVLLEDSCETLGSTYYGKKTGRFGIAASFSFFYSHHMTTIEGGMIVTDDDRFADLCRMMRAHGWSRGLESEKWRGAVEKENPDIDPRFLFITEGYNLRPTELNAAMGIHQLKRLDDNNALRMVIESKMRKVLEPYGDFIRPIERTPGAEIALMSFPVILEKGDRGEFAFSLESRGIQTRPIVAGNLARHPAMRRHTTVGALPNANMVARQGLYWGLHPNVTDEQIDHLGSVLKAYQERKAA